MSISAVTRRRAGTAVARSRRAPKAAAEAEASAGAVAAREMSLFSTGPAVAAEPGTAVILQMPASAVGVPAAGKALRSVRRESAVSAAAEEADRRGASAAAAAVTAAPAASAPAPVPAAQTRRAGGGGLGAGGDVFVQQGGTLIIQAGSLG